MKAGFLLQKLQGMITKDSPEIVFDGERECEREN